MANQYKRSIVLGLDYSEFSGGITECNRKMGLLEAEFKLAKEQAKNYGTETDQLSIKKEVLSQKIQIQNRIVDENRKAYDKAMSSGKATEKQVDDLDKKLLTARTTLEKLNGEYSQTCDELDEYTKKQKEAGEKAEESIDRQRTFGDAIRDIADTLGVEVNPKVEAFASKFDGVDEKAGLAVITLGTLATTLSTFAFSTAETVKEITNVSQIMGMTTDQYQEWDYVMRTVGSDAESMTGDIAALAEKARDATDKTSDTAKTFRLLGVNVRDSHGALKSQNELFSDVVKGLRNMTDETARNALASELLSTTGENIVPILNMTAKEFHNIQKEAHDTGYVIEGEALEKFNALNDAMFDMNTTSRDLQTNLGLAIVPALTGLFGTISKVPIPVIQALIGLVGAVSGFVLVYKAIKGVTDAGKDVVKMFKGMDIQTLKTTAIIIGVVAALIALATVIAVIIGKGNDLQNAMNSVGNSVNAVTNTVNTAQQVPHYASGTNYTTGEDAWVGEHGPELVRLPRGSRVIPNNVVKNGAETVNIFYCTIDAREIDDFNKVVKLAQQESQAYRTGRRTI